jgi:hypothetical protein
VRSFLVLAILAAGCGETDSRIVRNVSGGGEWVDFRCVDANTTIVTMIDGACDAIAERADAAIACGSGRSTVPTFGLFMEIESAELGCCYSPTKELGQEIIVDERSLALDWASCN